MKKSIKIVACRIRSTTKHAIDFLDVLLSEQQTVMCNTAPFLIMYLQDGLLCYFMHMCDRIPINSFWFHGKNCHVDVYSSTYNSSSSIWRSYSIPSFRAFCMFLIAKVSMKKPNGYLLRCHRFPFVWFLIYCHLPPYWSFSIYSF